MRGLAHGNGASRSLFVTGGIEWTGTRVVSADSFGTDIYITSGVAPVVGLEYRR